MRKITPKAQTILLYFFLVGSFFTSYANVISSFLTPPETDTHVSFFKVSTDEVSPVFRNFNEGASPLMEKKKYLDFSKRISHRLNPYSVRYYFKSNFKKKIQSHFSGGLILSKPLNSLEKNSNSGSCDNDNEKPTISTNGNKIQTTVSGECRANVTVSATANDNCSVGNPTGIRSDGKSLTTQYPIGTTTIKWNVTDANGNTATEVSQTVTVTDNEKPTITANGNKDVNTDAGQCGANVTVSATANDNCTVGNPTGVRNDGLSLTEQYPIGTTTIKWNVIDANGNSATEISQTVTVTDNEKPTISTNGNKNETTDPGECGANVTVSATANDNCTVGNPTGIRNDGLALTEQYPIGTTTIKWNVTDANGISATEASQTVTISDSEKPVAPTLSTIISGCEITIPTPTTTDNCDTELTVTSDRSPTFTSSGTIKWTFTDNANNSQTVSQNVTINQISVSINKTDILCNGASTGEVEAIVTGGVAPYTYDWGSLGTGSKKTGLTAGTYTIYVKDSNGCEAFNTIEIIQPELLVMASPNSTPVSCNGGSDGAVTAGTLSGGNPGSYQYKLDNGTYGATNKFSGLKAGTYKVYVKDSKGCEAFKTIEVIQPELLVMAAPTSTPVSCNGGSDGSITAGNLSGGNNIGTNPYKYSLTNDFSEEGVTFNYSGKFENLKFGSYTIFVKDANECALQTTINVGEADKLSASLTKKNVSCFDITPNISDSDGSITVVNPVGGSGSYKYRLNDGEWQANPTFSNLNPGIYSVAIQDALLSSCEVILNSEYEITQPTSFISATATATRTTAYGTSTGSATVNASGGTPGYTYEWTKVGSTEVIRTTKTANNLASGEYNVKITDTKGCYIELEESVTVLDALFASIESAAQCEETTLINNQLRTGFFRLTDLTAIGGDGNYTYNWDFGNASDINGDEFRNGPGEHSVEYKSPGNKTVTVTIRDNFGNGESYTLTQQLYVGLCHESCGQAQNAQFDVNAIYIGDINGNVLDLDDPNICGSGVDKYLFLPVSKDVNMYNPYTEVTFKTENGLTDIFEIQSDTGCKDEDEIDEVPLGNGVKPNQVGNFIRLTSQPIEYKCMDDLKIDGFYITYTNTSKKDCLDNNKGFCYSTNEPVVVPTPVYVEAIASQISCKDDPSGTISAKGTGGFAPYSYNITGNDDPYFSPNMFNNLDAGTYTVYIEDFRGNRNSTTVTITEPDESLSVEITPTNPKCYGEAGEATATIKDNFGGTPFLDSNGDSYYNYLWNDANEQTGSTATDLKAGSYTVTVTDANECQTISTVIIEEPAELTAPEAGEDQSFNCGVISTSLAANTPEEGEGKWVIKSGSGGSFPDGDETDPLAFFKGTANSTYVLDWTISNPDGTCLKSDEITITFSDDCSALDFDGLDDHVNFGDNYNFPTNNFTLEVWVKLDAIDGVRTVLSKRDASNLGSGGYDLVINNGAPTFRWGNISVSTSTKLTTSRWYQLAVSYNGDKYILYVDGLDVGTKTGVNPLSIESPFIIGAMHNNTTPEVPSNYFNGWIEELRIWNRALSEDQLHFMMNQRLEIGVSPVKGTILPLEVPGTLSWSDLQGYYQLIATDVANGITLDGATSKIDGILKNIATNQENSAPLPYKSSSNGVWSDKNTWARPDVWDYPNALGINGERIDWNIAEISHDISSGGHDINLLGLFSEVGQLKMLDPNYELGDNAGENENNPGQGLTITHYLKLDGEIKLYGDSQLIQTEGSILDNNSSGFIEKDQQGTASSFNYNYWSSPVVPQGNAINSTYSVAGVMMDGTDSKAPIILNFGPGVTFADGAASSPGNSQNISNYWIYKFRGKADEYSDFEHIGSTGILNVGEGYTMKGTSGNAAIAERQNYVFKGKPNNGNISLSVGKDQNYLLGNPYPSAIDANKFILDNLNASGGTNSNNIFNGALYFWDHFGGKTHTLREYVGGYATYNLIGGVKAIATDDRINNTNEASSDDHEPGQYIPVGQGFFINTVLDEELSGSITVDGGDVIFKNSQRAFIREQNYVSRFLSQEKNTANQKEAKSEAKIRLDFSSPMGYNRQILVGLSEYATNGFDLGYDAPLNDYNLEDFFWLINNREFVIQGVSHFDEDQVLPVGIYISMKGNFSIKINALENVPENTNIYLRDIEENKYFDLRDSEFKMEIEPGAYYERFEIVFSKPEETTPDSEEEEESSAEESEETNTEGSEETTEETDEEIEEIIIPENISISDIDIFYMSNNKELAISNPYLLPIQRVEIYNLLGQKIQQYMKVSTQKEIRLPVVEYATGIYIVKLYTGDSQVSKNIILK